MEELCHPIVPPPRLSAGSDTRSGISQMPQFEFGVRRCLGYGILF